MDDTEPFPLPHRLLLVALGLALVPVGLFTGYIALFFLDGAHGSLSPLQAAYDAAVLAIPLLLLAIGLASLAATNRRRLRVATFLFWALLADLPLVWLLAHAMMMPDCTPHPLPPSATPRASPIDATGCVRFPAR